jgi:hypothetical protein
MKPACPIGSPTGHWFTDGDRARWCSYCERWICDEHYEVHLPDCIGADEEAEQSAMDPYTALGVSPKDF